RFEPDEEAAKSRGRGLFDHVVAQDRIDGCGPLEDPAHPSHASEQSASEPRIPEEVIVEKVEMSAGKAGNLSESVVYELRVERAPSREETVFVAERAMVWTSSGDDNRVRHQVPL